DEVLLHHKPSDAARRTVVAPEVHRRGQRVLDDVAADHQAAHVHVVRHDGDAAELGEVAVLDRHVVRAEDPHRIYTALSRAEGQPSDGDMAGSYFDHIGAAAVVNDPGPTFRIRGADYQRGPGISAATDRAGSLIYPGPEDELLARRQRVNLGAEVRF